jgi:hypothetical protein
MIYMKTSFLFALLLITVRASLSGQRASLAKPDEDLRDLHGGTSCNCDCQQKSADYYECNHSDSPPPATQPGDPPPPPPPACMTHSYIHDQCLWTECSENPKGVQCPQKNDPTFVRLTQFVGTISGNPNPCNATVTTQPYSYFKTATDCSPFSDQGRCQLMASPNGSEMGGVPYAGGYVCQ